MSTYIGILQQDGVIRYVMTYEQSNRRLPAILKTFYPNESRVTALIELGNLYTVGPTPYGKSENFWDKLHCRAHIRDEREKKGKHQSRYAGSVKAFGELDGFKLLFKEGKWWYAEGAEFTSELPPYIEDKRQSSLTGLEISVLNKDGSISHFREHDVMSWKELEEKAMKNEDAYFIFRNNKLVATINHPLNRL